MPQENRSMKKLTPLLTVECIEDCLPFWVEGLGFELTAQVPLGGKEGAPLGFAMLNQGAIELMLQSQASLDEEASPVAELLRGSATALYLEVADLDAVVPRIAGAKVLVPRRETFYGMTEIFVRAPGGHVVGLAQPVAK